MSPKSIGPGDVVFTRSLRALFETPIVRIQSSFVAGKQQTIAVLVLGIKRDGEDFDAVHALKRLGWEPSPELARELASRVEPALAVDRSRSTPPAVDDSLMPALPFSNTGSGQP